MLGQWLSTESQVQTRVAKPRNQANKGNESRFSSHAAGLTLALSEVGWDPKVEWNPQAAQTHISPRFLSFFRLQIHLGTPRKMCSHKNSMTISFNIRHSQTSLICLLTVSQSVPLGPLHQSLLGCLFKFRVLILISNL